MLILRRGDGRELDRLLDASVKHDWVVYAKPPFGGPEQVLKYLARYTPPRRHLQPTARLDRRAST